MHDVTGTASEDGVKLVLARKREALVAAGLVAWEPVAVVPAPWPLTDIARQRADIPDLGRRDAARGFCEHRVPLLHRRVAAQRVEREQATDRDSSARGGDVIKTSDGLETDEYIGRDDAFLDEGKQVAAASRKGRCLAVAMRLSRQRHRLADF